MIFKMSYRVFVLFTGIEPTQAPPKHSITIPIFDNIMIFLHFFYSQFLSRYYLYLALSLL